MRGDQFEEQKSKLIEISIEDKLNLEEVISKMRFKASSDEQYIYEVENQLSRAKEEIMKLDNKCKKMEIKHDEEVFHRQWSKDNFQQQKQEACIKELESEVAEGKSKYRKERERRNQIEKRVLELEEVAGLSNVKAEVYEGEVDLITKKYKKMERKMSSAKVAVSKMTS